ncbi:MAG: hypothetical protein Q9174_004832, partial [Haloplaca sp. 1 TL-2023]
RSPRPQVAPLEIAALIEALDYGNRNLCRQLDDIAFQTVYAFLWNAQPDLAYERGHFLFVVTTMTTMTLSASQRTHLDQDSLHPSYAETLEERRVLVSRKETLGASVLLELINAFLNPSKPSRARRWVGSFALELLKDCPGNRQLLQQDVHQAKYRHPIQIALQPLTHCRSAFGNAVLQSSDEIQRLIAGRIIHEMVSRHDAGILRKDFWPAKISPATIRGFPINNTSESQWSTDFVKYMDDLESQNVLTQRRGYSAFVPGVQADDTTYESEESSSILVTLLDVLTILIPTSATDTAKYIDIPLNDVQLQLGDLDSQPTQDSLNARDVLVITFPKTKGEAYVVNGRPCGPLPLYIFFGNEEDAGFWYDEIGAKIQRPDENDPHAQDKDMDTLVTLRPPHLIVHSAFLDISQPRSEPGRAPVGKTGMESNNGESMDLIRTASEAHNLLEKTIQADGRPDYHAQTIEESNQSEVDGGNRRMVPRAEKTTDMSQNALHDALLGLEIEEGIRADSFDSTHKQRSASRESTDSHNRRTTGSPSAHDRKSSRDTVSKPHHRRGGSEAEATPSEATSGPRSGKLSRTMRVEDGEQPFVLPLTPAMLAANREKRNQGNSRKGASRDNDNNRKTATNAKLAAGTKRKSLAQQTMVSNKKVKHTRGVSVSSRSSKHYPQTDETTTEASVFDVPTSSPEPSKSRPQPLGTGKAQKKETKSVKPFRDTKRLKGPAVTSDETPASSSRRNVPSTKNTRSKEGPSHTKSTVDSKKLPDVGNGDMQGNEEGSNYVPSQQIGPKAKSKAAPGKAQKVSTAKQNTGAKRKAQRPQPRQDTTTGLRRQTRASTRRIKDMAPRSELALDGEERSSASKESEQPETIPEGVAANAKPHQGSSPQDDETAHLPVTSADSERLIERIEAEVNTDHPAEQRVDESRAALQPTGDPQRKTTVRSSPAGQNTGKIDAGEGTTGEAAPAGANSDPNQAKIPREKTAPQTYSKVGEMLTMNNEKEDQQSDGEAANFGDAMDMIAPDTIDNENVDDNLFEDGQAALQAFDSTVGHIITKDEQLAQVPNGSAAASGRQEKEVGDKEALEAGLGPKLALPFAQQAIMVGANEGERDHHHRPKTSTAESLHAGGAQSHLAQKLKSALSDVLQAQHPFKGEGDQHTEETPIHPSTTLTPVHDTITPESRVAKRVAVQSLAQPPAYDQNLQGSRKGPIPDRNNPKSGSQSDPVVVGEGPSSDHESEDIEADPGDKNMTPFNESYEERIVKPALKIPERVPVATMLASGPSHEPRSVLPTKGFSVDSMSRTPRQRIQTPAKGVKTNTTAPISANSGSSKDPNRLPRMIGFSEKGARNQGVSFATALPTAQAQMEPKRVSEGKQEHSKRKRELGTSDLEVADRTPAQTQHRRDSKRVRIEVLDDEMQIPAPTPLPGPSTRSGNVNDKFLVEQGSWFAGDSGPRNSSQSSRVDAKGSPLPLHRTRHAFFPPKHQRRLDDELSDSENVGPGLMDDDFTMVDRESDEVSEPELPAVAVSGRPQRKDFARIPSSNSKHGPSSPNAPSAMLTAFQAHEVHESGRLVNIETDTVLEPSKPQDPFMTKGREQPSGFLSLLRRATEVDGRQKRAHEKERKNKTQGLAHASKQIGDSRSVPEDEDPDATLVEDRRSRPRRRRHSTSSRTSDSIDSSRQDSSSSDSLEAREAAIRAWRDALDPRHQDILAILYEVSH